MHIARLTSLSALNRYDQYHRPLQLLGKFGVGSDLVRRRRPFSNVSDCESRANQRVQRRSDGAMLFYHVLGKPVHSARTLDGIAVYRPRLAAFFIQRPTGIGRSHVYRMLDREDEA